MPTNFFVNNPDTLEIGQRMQKLEAEAKRERVNHRLAIQQVAENSKTTMELHQQGLAEYAQATTHEERSQRLQHAATEMVAKTNSALTAVRALLGR